MSGNFLSCSKDPFEFPEFRCDEPPDASEEMGLISPGGENLLDFPELGRVSRVTTGTSGTRSGGLRKGQCPWELQGRLSGFLSGRCRGLRPFVESGLEPEDSSSVLTWILAYFWSFPWGVCAHLMWGHARELSSGTVAAVSHFPSRGSRDLWLSLEAFRRGFPTGLTHVPWCSVWILGVKVEAVQGKQVPLEWTDIWGSLGIVARHWGFSRFSC